MSVAALGGAASASASSPFVNGVTAGEITQNSAIVWAQTKRAGTVTAEVTDRGSKPHADLNVVGLKSKAANDFTVQVKLPSKLQPGTSYTYKFCQGKKCSDTGHFETAPKPS